MPAAINEIHKIGIVGAGAWGTALALVARRAGRDAILWARRPELADAINREARNPIYLPDIAIDPPIVATSDLGAVAASDAILLAVPAQHLRAIARQLAALLRAAPAMVICAKGVEKGTLALMTEVVAETMPRAALAVLSGPTFAPEVARTLPTAVTLAAKDATLAGRLVAALGSPVFRPYLSDDPIGAQIGGAVKNVLAIACGIVRGRQLGENAAAALMTRGFAEIMRMGAKLGAKRETLMGLSGLGDLTLTCNSAKSRNTSLGIALGKGETLTAVLAERRSVAEGVDSAAAVSELARRLGIEMPIVMAVDAILHRGADLDAVIGGLLARPFRDEL